MESPLDAAPDPWLVELLVVRDHSHSGGERRALTRDVARGLLTRLTEGGYVERVAFEAMATEAQHIVRLRAIAEVSDRPPIFSHSSAAVLHGLPVLRARLRSAHVTVASPGSRGRRGVTGHVFALEPDDVVRFGTLRATHLGRTVIDVAGGSPFEEGVMVADGALHAGLPREALEIAAEVAGARKGATRIGDVIAFAHAGAESAAESRSRVTMYRIGTEPPTLQYRIGLSHGRDAYLDFLFPSARIGGEADGDSKYLDADKAPRGAARSVLDEKHREDEVRAQLNGLARWGWAHSGNIALLRGVLAQAGVITHRPRPTLTDYARAARDGRGRFVQLGGG